MGATTDVVSKPVPIAGSEAESAAQATPVGHRGSSWQTVRMYAITLFCLVTVLFLLPRAMPGDPLSSLIDPDEGEYYLTPEARERLEEFYGLDGSLGEQYVGYLTGLVRGDFGYSISRKVPVAQLIRAHLPWTLLLVGTALAVTAILSFVAGVSAAWRRGKADDRAVIATFTALRAVPEFASGSVLLIAFAVLLPIFPLYGGRTMFAEHASWFHATIDVLYHLALPLFVLVLSLMGTKFLLVRNTVVGALGQDYMVLARAKGLPTRMLKYRHAGRNALLPFLTVLGIQAGFAVGGAVFVESIFAYPGMGSLILNAVENRDFPVLEAVFLTLAITVLVANLVIDLVYLRVDPRTESRA